eukprot:COSAG01_NODE_15648_length_1315_cov_1.338816_2_plen_130_part_01
MHTPRGDLVRIVLVRPEDEAASAVAGAYLRTLPDHLPSGRIICVDCVGGGGAHFRGGACTYSVSAWLASRSSTSRTGGVISGIGGGRCRCCCAIVAARASASSCRAVIAAGAASERQHTSSSSSSSSSSS